MSRTLAYLFAASFLAFAGCAETGMVEDASGAMAERNDFKSARSAGTPAAMSSFLERYPQSSYRDKAAGLLDDAIWRETQRTNTAAAYFAFAQNKPKYRAAGESKDRCRKLLEDGHGDEQDYLTYLRAYPDDADAGSLRRAMMTVRYHAVVSAANADSSSLFVSQYPGTPESAKLLPDLQAQAYQTAEALDTRLAYRYFLKLYPTSSEASKAQDKLDQLGTPLLQKGDPADLKKLLPALRRASAPVVRRECRKGLETKIRRSRDLFGPEAEELRAHLKVLSSEESIPPFCSAMTMIVSPAARQTAANAVRALAALMERQQYLNSVAAVPDRIASTAEQTASQAEAAADTSETSELEIEALYGNMPADPQHPEESASRNTREAARRARRAGELVQGMSQKDEVASILASARREADLLVEILVALEKPSAGLEEQPAAQQESAPASRQRPASSDEPAQPAPSELAP